MALRRFSPAAALVGALTLALALVSPVGATTAVVPDNVRHITNVPGSTGGHVDVDGDRLYMGSYGYGMQIFDISDPADPQHIGDYVPGPQDAGDPGLRADAVPAGATFEVDGVERRIAVLQGTGRTGGTQQSEFLDVTDPEEPVLLHRFSSSADGEAHNGELLPERNWWIASGSGGENGLRIYDVTPLVEHDEEPESIARFNPAELWNESPHNDGDGPPATFNHTHDTETYLDHPVLLPEDEWVDGEPTYVERDIVLLADGGSYFNDAGNSGAIYIIDVTDPTDPVVLNRWANEDGDAHIRYFHEVQFLDGDPTVMLVTDEDLHNGCEAGGVHAVRVSEDLTEATKLSEWFHGTGTPAANCSVHVFSTHGDHMFIGSYNAGLQVVDYSEPENPTRAGQYIAPGAHSWGAQYHEGVVYVGDMGGRGLDVFEFVPDPVAEGIVAPNPATQNVPGFNEMACEETGEPVGPTVDALMVEIGEEHRDGETTIRALGSNVLPYNIKIYFYGPGCTFMSGVSLNADTEDIEGSVPFGAHYAAVTNALGGPTQVYVQLLR